MNNRLENDTGRAALGAGAMFSKSRPAGPFRRLTRRPAALTALSAIALAVPGFAHSQVADTELWTRGNLLGDIGGVRTSLGSVGITVGLQETDEVLGNLTGGTHQSAAYDGLTAMSVGVDTLSAFGLKGGTFNVSVLQIRGRNLSTDNLQSLQTASSIEALPSTRLWEAWYQQSIFDGRLDLKIGQQSVDQEFLISTGSSLFINSVMGWPMPPAIDLYAGGPDYPLASLGARLRVNAVGPFSILAAVYDDNPPGGSFNNDSQLRGAEQTGTLFHLGTGALFVTEVQYALNQPAGGKTDDSGPAAGLAGTYKLGAWFDSGFFPDQRFDTNGVPLASPLSNGNPKMHRSNYSFYGVFDQAIWRPDAASPRMLSVFARIMDGPGDRNLIPFSVNAGVTLKAPLPGRDHDTAGIGWGMVAVGRNASGFDQDVNLFGAYRPIRSSETMIEVTYQYQAAGWWQIQPDFQYVFMPGAGISNPLDPTRRIANEVVLGLRSTFVF
jgi:porin